MCSNIFECFLTSLGEFSYLEPNGPKTSNNRLFGMYHSNTPNTNKKILLDSLLKPDGVLRIIFATNALGMGINIENLNKIVHYGAPSTLEDYFQESGRAGRAGNQSSSVVYWTPKDCPLYTEPKTNAEHGSVIVRKYVESTSCRRELLLEHFDSNYVKLLPKCNPILCCDNCRKSVSYI